MILLSSSFFHGAYEILMQLCLKEECIELLAHLGCFDQKNYFMLVRCYVIFKVRHAAYRLPSSLSDKACHHQED